MQVLVQKRHAHAHVHGERACIHKCECNCGRELGRECMLLAKISRSHDVDTKHVEERLESIKPIQLGNATSCKMRCYPKGCAAPSDVQGWGNKCWLLSMVKTAQPLSKTRVTCKSLVGDISDVTLIRTDATRDHSQKAEKVWRARRHANQTRARSARSRAGERARAQRARAGAPAQTRAFARANARANARARKRAQTCARKRAHANENERNTRAQTRALTNARICARRRARAGAETDGVRQ